MTTGHTIPTISPTQTPARATQNNGHHPQTADRVEGCCLFAFAVALAMLVADGNYTRYTTPRTLPYIIIAVAVLAVLGALAWRGLFHMTVRGVSRMFVALGVPVVILLVPFQTEQSPFDQFAGNRAVAIESTGNGARLHGLDAARRTIVISDDEFGSWYEEIDQHPDHYTGYTITATGFVSTSSTSASRQFRLSRMLMTCCIMDMTPFGFTAQYADGAHHGGDHMPKDHEWVTVRGTLSVGAVGAQGHSSTGMILHILSVTPAEHTPSGYFYRP